MEREIARLKLLLAERDLNIYIPRKVASKKLVTATQKKRADQHLVRIKLYSSAESAVSSDFHDPTLATS